MGLIASVYEWRETELWADGVEPSVSGLEAITTYLSHSALSQDPGRRCQANFIHIQRKSQTIYYSIDDIDVL